MRKLTCCRTIVVLSAFGCSVAQVGCQFGPTTSNWPQKLISGEKQYAIPERMMVIWTDTILHQPQQPGVRGFGGRIYFYKGNNADPIEVDGGVAIYAFDAADGPQSSTKPKRKFVFTADQFAEYMSHTDLGPSYSVWIPWDQVGGPSQQLSLVTRFEGRQGGVVISDPVIKLLPGVDRSVIEDAAAIAQASYAGPPRGSIVTTGGLPTASQRANSATPRWTPPTPLEGTQPPARDVATIDLPPSFVRHLQGKPVGEDEKPANAPQPTTAEAPSEPPEPTYQPTPSNYFHKHQFRARDGSADWIHNM